MQAYHSKTL